MSVNLSAREFADPELAAVMGAAARDAGVNPTQIIVEITESALMEDVEETASTLRELKELGLRVSIDDFGTGYSSLSYLKKFPIDALKIDRSFVDGLGVDAEDEAIVGAIVGMARALDLEVVAEGVETAMQMEMVRGLGCDVVQGYLVGRPQSAEDLGALLAPTPTDPAKVTTAHAA
jgi:EAL domain-containing protein (putative c-di-GMP-specific phosphodiesterase class I)